MTRFAAFLVAAVAALASARPTAAAADRPNVLLIFADDQRADTIAALGNPHIRTPNLDKLVNRGLSFRRAYMQGGFNAATCVPSRAMLLSGRSLFRVDETLKTETTWPEAFGKAGYTTFASGKWHNAPAALPKAFQQARSMFTGGMTDPLKAKLSNLDGGKLTPPVPTPKHACQAFADEAVAFLKSRQKGDAPFLLYLPFDGPHDPHVVPAEFPVKYDPAALPLPPNFLPLHPFDNGEMRVRDEQLLPWPRTPESVRAQLADYYRYVSYLDALIGQVLDALVASPFADNTIVVFTSDSGVARGSHGLNGKQNLYEHSMSVPLVIAGPGVPQNKRTEAMCYLFDLFPTLGGRCGVPAPPGSEGVDLAPVLRDPTAAGRDRLVFGYKQLQRAVRDDRWKLIRYPKVDVTQLFDLSADPFETRDLADDPTYAARVREMSATLAADLKAAGDKAPLTVDKPLPKGVTAEMLNRGRPATKPVGE